MREITRREAMKSALKAGAYATPIILSAVVPSAVSAQVSGPMADIALLKTVDNPTPLAFSTVTFTVTATNNGPAAATGVVVSDVVLGLPFTPTSSTPSQGTYSNITGIWAIGPLAVGQSVNLKITGQVGITPFTNTATVTASSPTDPDPKNNSASASVSLVRAAGVQSATITQRATTATCGGGSPGQFVQTFILQLAYDEVGQALDIYISPNNASPVGDFTLLGSVTTDGQGRARFAGSVTVTTQTATPPTSVTFNVVDQGDPPQAALSSKTYPVTTTVPCETP